MLKLKIILTSGPALENFTLKWALQPFSDFSPFQQYLQMGDPGKLFSFQCSLLSAVYAQTSISLGTESCASVAFGHTVYDSERSAAKHMHQK